MIRALFFDIDGTLVSFETHSIPHSTVQALQIAKAKGIRIFISTGRPYALINNLDAINPNRSLRFLCVVRQREIL